MLTSVITRVPSARTSGVCHNMWYYPKWRDAVGSAISYWALHYVIPTAKKFCAQLKTTNKPIEFKAELNPKAAKLD